LVRTCEPFPRALLRSLLTSVSIGTANLEVVSELGYIGLVLFLVALSIVIALLINEFDRPTVGLIIGFIIAFVPLFSIWEISGFRMVLGLGLAALGRQVTTQSFCDGAFTDSTKVAEHD
jgi:hypothetical protein